MSESSEPPTESHLLLEEQVAKTSAWPFDYVQSVETLQCQMKAVEDHLIKLTAWTVEINKVLEAFAYTHQTR